MTREGKHKEAQAMPEKLYNVYECKISVDGLIYTVDGYGWNETQATCNAAAQVRKTREGRTARSIHPTRTTLKQANRTR